MAPRKAAKVEALCTEEYPEVEETRSGLALTKTAFLSKTFVAYFEALVAAAPFCKTTDSRNKLEDSFHSRELNKHDNMQFDQYIARKRRAWYTKFPPKQPIWGLGGGGSDDDGEGGSGGAGTAGQGDSDESNEAIALSCEE